MSDTVYTNVFSRNIEAFNNGYRRIVNKGGTSSSKTISVLQLLLEIAIARRNDSGVIISVISETFPHLRLGAMRDFEKILANREFQRDRDYELSNHVYYFKKSIIEFFSADSGKATGPRRDIAYLNECNNINYNVVTEIEQRTRECIFYDYNPHSIFWIEDKVISLPENERYVIKSNYLDNDQLDSAIRKEIELKASRDPNYKRVHVDVEYGISEGLIFTHYNLVDEMPDTDRQRHGIDFGFTNDPTTLIDLRLNNGELWIDELLYRTQMTNQDIISILKSFNLERKIIVADSAEPKSIEEIYRAGVNIKPAVKGADSINRGIDLLKTYKLNVTKRSINLIKELRNYSWRISKDGSMTNEPIDNFNHAIDALRYAAEDLLTVKHVQKLNTHYGAARLPR